VCSLSNGAVSSDLSDQFAVRSVITVASNGSATNSP